MGVSRFEIGRKGSWIAASDDNKLCVLVLLLSSNEVCQIRESLLTREVLKVLIRPIIEWLRSSVVSVLQNEDSAFVLSSHLQREHPGVRHAAGVLPTNVKERR